MQSYLDSVIKEHSLCVSSLSDHQAKAFSTCLNLRTKEFLLRQFITPDAQQEFLRTSEVEGGCRDIEDDDFYDFYFEK